MTDSYGCSTHDCPSPPLQPSSEKSLKSVDDDVCKCISQFSCIESASSGFEKVRPRLTKKIDYRKAKLILKQPSASTGENLFDHLVETIKRVIDERPVNVADYFEQYSHNVRENKYSDLCAQKTNPEPQFLQPSVNVIQSFKPPSHPTIYDVLYGGEEDSADNLQDSSMTAYSSSSFGKLERTLAKNENTIQLQHFWGFCGLGFQIDEIFQLSLAIQKVLYHRFVRNARFWGRIFGINGSYYIVEAMLIKSEVDNRLEKMRSNLLGDMIAFINKRDHTDNDIIIDPNLIPGAQWQGFPQEDLAKMRPQAEGIPLLNIPEKFEAPPESIGVGVNRRVYFVTTSLSADWQELPIVTTKQIQISKKIKKFLTGDLDASVVSYPLFPGTEKNYLRAMIARITAGTYIAPEGFYRRMTKKEIREMEREPKVIDGENEEEEGNEEEEEGYEEEEEEVYDNDALLTESADYEPIVLDDLTYPCSWLHVRPNILDQGRVLHVDEELAIRSLEVKAQIIIKSSQALGECGEEEELGEEEENAENVEDGEEEHLPEEAEERPPPEEGPDLFTPCDQDENNEYTPPWTPKYSSIYNLNNQMIIMRSNLWPGAYTFTFQRYCDSTYIGWGMKYVSRCMALENAPDIQNYEASDNVFEATDPTPEMEEKWRLYHLRKDTYGAESGLSDVSVEFDIYDEDHY